MEPTPDRRGPKTVEEVYDDLEDQWREEALKILHAFARELLSEAAREAGPEKDMTTDRYWAVREDAALAILRFRDEQYPEEEA